jgi:hypothetical protein
MQQDTCSFTMPSSTRAKLSAHTGNHRKLTVEGLELGARRPAPAPSEDTDTPISAWCSDNGLDQALACLQDLGATRASDLALLTPAEVKGIKADLSVIVKRKLEALHGRLYAEKLASDQAVAARRR